MASVFTFPLASCPDTLGALDLHRESPGELSKHDLDAAQTLAEAAGAYLVSARNRVAARAETDAFRHDSPHDPLTGLPNRAMIQDRLEHVARRAVRTPTNVAILFTDIDCSKRSTKMFGHAVGDDLLVAVARTLTGVLRPGDALVRLSGDEFVIVCEDFDRPDNAVAVAERVIRAFVPPFQLSDHSVSIFK